MPRACAAASASTIGPIFSAFSPLIDDEPTFTMTRRAPARSPRCSVVTPRPRRPSPSPRQTLGLELGAGVGLGIHQLVVVLAALRGGAPGVLDQARVRAARRGHELGGRGERRLPVEDDAVALADHDGRPGDRAGAEQLVLDAELLEAIGEVAHGLLVLEVGLLHPALGLLAEDPVHGSVRAALDADVKSFLAPRGG